MKTTRLFKTGAAILGLAALALQAEAGVIKSDSHTGNFAYNQAAVSDTVLDSNAVTLKSPNELIYIPMFDSSLGTLVDVEINFLTSWSFSSTFRATDPYGNFIGTGGSGRSSTDMRVRLVDPKTADNKNTVERIKVVERNNCNEYSNSCRDNDNLSGDFNGSLDWASGLTLNDFIGTGDLKFSMYRNMLAKLTTCGFNDTCVQRNRQNNWGGSVTVNYKYDVPEPSTLALLSLGLIGLGAGRLKKRS